MKFTTHLGLHSQATRLFVISPYHTTTRVTDGVITLYDTLFQRTDFYPERRWRQHFRLQPVAGEPTPVTILSFSRFARRY